MQIKTQILVEFLKKFECMYKNMISEVLDLPLEAASVWM